MMIRRLAVFSLMSGVWSCGNDVTAPEGTYQLVELKGQPLPYDDLPGCCVYTSGSLRLEGGHYDIGITFRNRNNGMVATAREQGTYVLTGTAIEFRATGGDAPMHLYNAHIEGSEIRLALGGDGPGAADQFDAVFAISARGGDASVARFRFSIAAR